MGKTCSSVDEHEQNFRSVLFALCKTVDTPRSLAVWLCYKYDHLALTGLEIQPGGYGDATLEHFLCRKVGPQTFAADLNVTEFVSKYKGLKLPFDTKEEAIRSFKNSELRLASVNSTLKQYLTKPASPRLEAIISIARRKISQVLGVVSESSVVGGWGPGATFTIKGDVGWDKKIREKRISVTASALPYAARLIGADIHWCQARGIPAEGPCTLLSTEFKVVPGNRITTVPKNAKTDRTIAVEPTGNIYLQKAVGSWIRGRLKKIARIDLDDQKPNQKAAGTLANATIDLKAASDSISISVVRLLLSDEWYDWLGSLRSENYLLQGKWSSYEKWSSMGNGYTFELETLIFWALASATQILDTNQSYAQVYGDDIIVPVSCARSVVEVLSWFGFETNSKKTHYSSLYRESCGAHYFDGWYITPIYQKETLSHVEEIYNLANRLRHFATRLGGYWYSCSSVKPAWLDCIRLARRRHSLFYSPLVLGEDEYGGTLHLSIEDLEELGLPLRSYGYRTRSYVFVAKKRSFDPAAGLSLYLGQSARRNPSNWLSEIEGLPTPNGGKLAIRGRGRVEVRSQRIFRSFRSNTWL